MAAADLVALVRAGETAHRRGVRLPFLIAIGFFVAGLVVAAAAPRMQNDVRLPQRRMGVAELDRSSGDPSSVSRVSSA